MGKNKSVNVGDQGLTPKKYIHSSYIAQDKKNRKVNTGIEGETPIKVFEFDKNQSISNGEKLFDKSRPKTGRGKSHPSPDEFFDYVVPSPEQKAMKPKKSLIYSLESSLDENADNDIEQGEGLRLSFANESENSVTDNLNSSWRSISLDMTCNDNDEEKIKQIRLLGCWLFGSGLRI